jgi:hypothetical protein
MASDPATLVAAAAYNPREDAHAMLRTAITASASPKAVAALGSSLLRTLTAMLSPAFASKPPTSDDIDTEIQLRWQTIKPVLAEKVRAGSEGRASQLTGRARAARNVGEHFGLGAGVTCTRHALAQPQASQRGCRNSRRSKRYGCERDGDGILSTDNQSSNSSSAPIAASGGELHTGTEHFTISMGDIIVESRGSQTVTSFPPCCNVLSGWEAPCNINHESNSGSVPRVADGCTDAPVSRTLRAQTSEETTYEGQQESVIPAYKIVEKSGQPTVAQDSQPGARFIECLAKWKGAVQIWKQSQRDYKAGRHASVTAPHFNNFAFEDWALLSIRFELHLLMHALSEGNDAASIVNVNDVPKHYFRFFHEELKVSSFGLQCFRGLADLISDTVQVTGDCLQPMLAADAQFDDFLLLAAAHRRDRLRRIDAGDETAILYFTRIDR